MAHEHSHGVVEDLTRNQALVLSALEKAGAPLSAYSILDELRDEGFRAPLQVYRALEKLMTLGVVHRLESINAFVVCSHSGCRDHAAVAFMICDTCGQSLEINDPLLKDQLTQIAGREGFTLNRSTVELRGLCALCAVPKK